MRQNEITKLKKQYPADKFTIIQSRDSLIVSPKKVTVRIFKYQAKKIKGEASKQIEKAMASQKLTKQDFEQSQVTIVQELKAKLDQEAAKCKTRRLIYLQRLLNGN